MTDDVEGCPPSASEVILTLMSEAGAGWTRPERIAEHSTSLHPAASLTILYRFEPEQISDEVSESFVQGDHILTASSLLGKRGGERGRPGQMLMDD